MKNVLKVTIEATDFYDETTQGGPWFIARLNDLEYRRGARYDLICECLCIALRTANEAKCAIEIPYNPAVYEALCSLTGGKL